MSDAEVLDLFRRAVADDDPVAMRAGLDRVLGLTSGTGLSAEEEYRVRHPDYVMEMPQSGERIRGREAMRAMQEAFPTPPRLTVRRVVGAGRVWVLEGVNDYGGDVWHVALVLEFDDDGRIVRDTRYYAQPVERPPGGPPGWSRSVDPQPAARAAASRSARRKRTSAADRRSHVRSPSGSPRWASRSCPRFSCRVLAWARWAGGSRRPSARASAVRPAPTNTRSRISGIDRKSVV